MAINFAGVAPSTARETPNFVQGAYADQVAASEAAAIRSANQIGGIKMLGKGYEYLDDPKNTSALANKLRGWTGIGSQTPGSVTQPTMNPTPMAGEAAMNSSSNPVSDALRDPVTGNQLGQRPEGGMFNPLSSQPSFADDAGAYPDLPSTDEFSMPRSASATWTPALDTTSQEALGKSLADMSMATPYLEGATDLAADAATDAIVDQATDLATEQATSSNLAGNVASFANNLGQGDVGGALKDVVAGAANYFAPGTGTWVKGGLNAVAPTKNNSQRNADALRDYMRYGNAGK